MLKRSFVVLWLAAAMLVAQPANAQTPRIAPQAGYQFVDESTLGRFVIQRWVDAASPDVSPAGMCVCLTVVYLDTRKIVTLGVADDISAISVGPLTGRDINGDGLPDVVVSTWSGGAHCCYTMTAYSVGDEVATVLSLSTGNCGPGEFEDLDGDGVLEFSTCDDQWAYEYCSFAYSPVPRAVFAYDAARREYRPATPRFAIHLRNQIAADLTDAGKRLAESGGKDPGMDKCAVLQPALGLMYAGQLDDGLALIKKLYRGSDLDAFLRDTASRVQASPFWTER